MRFVDSATKTEINDKVLDESTEVSEKNLLKNAQKADYFPSIMQMEFEKDKDTKESDNDDDDKVKSSENVSIKDAGSPEKLPLSDDDEDDDDKNNTDSKSSSVPGTDDKKKKP